LDVDQATNNRSGTRGTKVWLGATGTSCWPYFFTDMNNQDEEQLMLWRAAFMAIGRALRDEFECEQPHEAPDRIRRMLAQLETIGKPKNEQ
jgi:hypothetical protein